MLLFIQKGFLREFLSFYKSQNIHTSVRTLAKKSVSKKYSSTLFLPSTSFPVKLEGKKRVERDRENFEKCNFSQMYSWQRENRRGPEFILHDGPPYANGSPHIGHAMNKILKDITIRFECSQGKKVHFVAGWDCHGLPIELKAVKGNKKLAPQKIREIAQNFALSTLNVQRDQFSKWGVLTDWTRRYATLDPAYVKRQMKIFHEMYQNNMIFQNYMPVYWSPSSKTALAEAELEYNPSHLSTSVYLRFKLNRLPASLSKYKQSNIYAMIWTTTPWSLAANQAICYHQREDYSILEHKDEFYIVANKLLNDDKIVSALPNATVVETISGSDLAGSGYVHPLEPEVTRPFLHGDHVTVASGTGLVHTAPAHGQDDFRIGMVHNLVLDCHVDQDGCYTNSVNKHLAGLDIMGDGNKRIIELLSKDILLQHEYSHSYPYDWRTKKPVFLRASKQWFIDTSKLKEQALEAIDEVIIHPHTAKNTLKSVVEKRPYWCISRQRVWGTKIPIIYKISTEEPVINSDLMSRYCDLVDKHGTGFWWTLGIDEVLDGTGLNPEEYRLGDDILDIWFDSGVSWSAVLGGQADMYLEGLDQFSGWFYTSLLTSVALTGKPPYKEIFVHGFTLDEHGNKMSKSIGNVVDPSHVTEGTKSTPAKGVDVLRWWVGLHASSGTSVLVGDNILAASQTEVNKIRNIIKFCVGMLGDWKAENNVDYNQLKLLDKILLLKLRRFQDKVVTNYKSREYNKVCLSVLGLVAEISATHLHLVKDRLYCDEAGSLERLSGLTALCLFTQGLLGCLCPVLPLLSEEAGSSVPCLQSPAQAGLTASQQWDNIHVANSCELLEEVRNQINKLTQKPSDHHLNLQINREKRDLLDRFTTSEIAEVLGVLSIQYSQYDEDNVEIELLKSDLSACERCRKLVAADNKVNLCQRCQTVIQNLDMQSQSVD